jgi:hypothetical protein
MVCIANEEGIGGCRYRLNTFSDGSRNLAVISGVCPNGLHDLAPIGNDGVNSIGPAVDYDVERTACGGRPPTYLAPIVSVKRDAGVTTFWTLSS